MDRNFLVDVITRLDGVLPGPVRQLARLDPAAHTLANTLKTPAFTNVQGPEQRRYREAWAALTAALGTEAKPQKVAESLSGLTRRFAEESGQVLHHSSNSS